LSDKGSVSYVDLMNAVEIKNTGKFNYHLKILGDLIEKDENGKYGLSEKGQLAVQFLQKFDSAKGGKQFLRPALSICLQVSYGWCLSTLLWGCCLAGICILLTQQPPLTVMWLCN
jgi:hypothetical protein